MELLFTHKLRKGLVDACKSLDLDPVETMLGRSYDGCKHVDNELVGLANLILGYAKTSETPESSTKASQGPSSLLIKLSLNYG